MDVNVTPNVSEEEDPRVRATSYLMYKIGKTLNIDEYRCVSAQTPIEQLFIFQYFFLQEKESTKFTFLFWFH